MAIVTTEEVQAALGRDLKQIELNRLEDDLASIQSQLEAWAHQKFEPVLIVDERHYVSDNAPMFLHWGEAANGVMVKYMSPNSYARPLVNYRPDYGAVFPGYRGRVYVTYEVDTTNVAPYESIIKQVIKRAAIAGIMRPDIVRFRITNSYSVEGLSIQFADGSSRATSTTGIGELPDVETIDLVALKGLKRTVMT